MGTGSAESSAAGGAQRSSAGSSRVWIFLLWLGVFYLGWGLLVVLGGYGHSVLTHWPIAAAMAAGSYFAGSTPMGGGTVGFPVLVLLFDMPASLGRNFGLAVQSVGMISASVFILATGRPVAWNLLRPALLGAVIGTPIGAALIAPYAPDLGVKLLFAVIWGSFGIIHLMKVRRLVEARGILASTAGMDRGLGLLIGLTGGVAASLTGVGIDMVVYAVLALLYRADLKMAVPTSVILMAVTSVIGIAVNTGLAQFSQALYAIDPEVFYNWLAAAPVVALGAPLGALVVSRLSRAPTLLLVSVLCVGQFFWTIVKEGVTGGLLAAALAGLVVMIGLFQVMFRWGERRAGAGSAVESPDEPATGAAAIRGSAGGCAATAPATASRS